MAFRVSVLLMAATVVSLLFRAAGDAHVAKAPLQLVVVELVSCPMLVVLFHRLGCKVPSSEIACYGWVLGHHQETCRMQFGYSALVSFDYLAPESQLCLVLGVRA